MSRDPEAIQREIEQARDALAETLDTLAERTNPRRVAERGRQVLVDRLRSPEGTRALTMAAGVVVLLVAYRAGRARRARRRNH
ncbi:MAG TPA: DUF3618 domain-containing protein [Mycobacteriales bacterium]|jgi:Protein of unknown function (DUF3618).